MFTAESLASYVLDECHGDKEGALSVLCDGEYLETLFPSPKFDSPEDASEYADSDENKKNIELVDCAYAILKAMK